MPAVNGGRVGRGIYLANELSKSASYVRPTTVAATGERLESCFSYKQLLGSSALYIEITQGGKPYFFILSKRVFLYRFLVFYIS